MIIGLDMGGTNIDAVIIKDGSILKVVKQPVDFDNMFNSIWNVILELIKNIEINDIKKINLSTTVSTNAIVENKVSDVGLVLQTGPGLTKEYFSNFQNIKFISGYTDHRGIIVKAYDENEITNIVNSYKNSNINDVAIITKFSTRNNETELKIQKAFNNKTNTTLGHLMSGKLSFPRRINTSYLNAAVKDSFMQFANNIIKAVEQLKINVPINVLKADGGIMDINYAKKQPVETIMSGPSASLMGILALTEITSDAILIDIGGTTTDVFFLADGIPLFEPMGINISDYKTLIRSIYSKSIGLGADSFIEVVNNQIKIAPKRLDKALAFGGRYPTPTDALVVLGKTTIGNKELAVKGISKIAKELNLDLITTSNLIIETFINSIEQKVNEYLNEINNKPVYTIKEILENKQLKPKQIVLIGGPAKSLSKDISEKFNIEVNYPLNYQVANAIGASLAKTTAQITLTANTETRSLMIPELGIKESINSNFNLNDAKAYALSTLENHLKVLGNTDKFETEIIEESIFNMVDGFYTKGLNIRVQAQVKPGLTKKIGVVKW